MTRFIGAASTNVDALIKVLAAYFRALVSSTIVPLNSFQTSGNSPGEPRLGSPARCRVGILGFGTVGSAIARRLTGPDSPSSLQLTHICDRRAREKRARQAEALAQGLVWTDTFDDLLASDVDIVVEAVVGAEPAVDYVRGTLLAGKSVVTANKQVIAHHGPALLTLAERQGRQLRFEASVGGAMPIVRALTDGLAGERIVRIEATLNGAANAVLSQMDAVGCAIEDAVADACARGYAEGDPSADLDGRDPAAKLAVLCAIGFGLRVVPADIDTRSAAALRPDDFRSARERGGTIRQIARAEYQRERATLVAWVAPTFVPSHSVFARAVGPQNAAVITGAHAGDITLTATGAGGEATAVAAIGDLITIARDRAAIVPAPMLREPAEIRGLTDRKLAEAV
jgi:homoserine dehydrogenase